jgi:hypothetical protein
MADMESVAADTSVESLDASDASPESLALDQNGADAHSGSESDNDDFTTSNGSSNGGTAANALRENIAVKGKNAYYYAHARQSDAPAVSDNVNWNHSP